jgi:hypothetical protein
MPSSDGALRRPFVRFFLATIGVGQALFWVPIVVALAIGPPLPTPIVVVLGWALPVGFVLSVVGWVCWDEVRRPRPYRSRQPWARIDSRPRPAQPVTTTTTALALTARSTALEVHR